MPPWSSGYGQPGVVAVLPYGIAIVVVALHHGGVGTLYPHIVFSHGAVHDPWLWAGIHAAFVLAASLALRESPFPAGSSPSR